VWRSNLLGSSGKGHEYFLKHLLGVPDNAVRAEESPSDLRPREVVWREHVPEGKLDLLTTIDFRMTSNALFSDVVLPAATRYEKHHLSSTDLHPFVHELQGHRGGTDNSLTRIVMKPTHFIGGYAQLSFGFNYYGPTGSQRDEVTVLRKRESKIVFE
jgi:nitrate reductase alpha subunit